MSAKAFNRDHHLVFGRFCAILLGVALTWTCAIYGLLFATAPSYGGGKHRQAYLRIVMIDSALTTYAIENNRCPETADDLVARKQLSVADLSDPWNTPIAFQCAVADDLAMKVRSAGPDRRFNTADDVTNE